MKVGEAINAVASWKDAPVEQRVGAYNAMQRELGKLVADVTKGDPACAPQLLPAEEVRGNTWNPNSVAAPELVLLEESMRADGITMPVVVVKEGAGWTIVDGFHRHRVATERLGRGYLVASIIERPLGDRMASTVRHNRARGKHGVEPMASLVRELVALGWENARIATALGMSVEELLRLCQLTGIAKTMAAESYSREWGPVGENGHAATGAPKAKRRPKLRQA